MSYQEVIADRVPGDASRPLRGAASSLLAARVWSGVLVILPARDRGSVDENIQFRS
jgi:hypothetical protein